MGSWLDGLHLPSFPIGQGSAGNASIADVRPTLPEGSIFDVAVLDMQTVVDEAVAIRNTTKMEERSKKLDKAVEFIRCSFEYRDSTKQSVIVTARAHALLFSLPF